MNKFKDKKKLTRNPKPMHPPVLRHVLIADVDSNYRDLKQERKPAVRKKRIESEKNLTWKSEEIRTNKMRETMAAAVNQ